MVTKGSFDYTEYTCDIEPPQSYINYIFVFHYTLIFNYTFRIWVFKIQHFKSVGINYVSLIKTFNNLLTFHDIVRSFNVWLNPFSVANVGPSYSIINTINCWLLFIILFIQKCVALNIRNRRYIFERVLCHFNISLYMKRIRNEQGCAANMSWIYYNALFQNYNILEEVVTIKRREPRRQSSICVKIYRCAIKSKKELYY